MAQATIKQGDVAVYAAHRVNDNGVPELRGAKLDNGVPEYCGDHLMAVPNSVSVSDILCDSKTYGDSK